MPTKRNNSIDAESLSSPPVDALLDELEIHPGSNLIGACQKVQGRLGYLPTEALVGLSRRLNAPLSRIRGVVSFYAQFYTKPRGKHTVRCCRGTACHVRGGGQVLNTVKNVLGIEDGETSDDMLFSLETVACLGACATAPVVVIDGVYYGKVTPQRIADTLNRIREAENNAEDRL